MAAPHTVPNPLSFRKSGVITLWGYGISVTQDRGHLLLKDGIGSDRREIRLPRVAHGLKRLVVIGSDGMITLSALRWLADQGAAFVMLERNGKVITVCGPVFPSDARLRRAQTLAHETGKALEISRELIRAKVGGQERVVRGQLKDSTAADLIARFQGKLSTAANLDTIRHLESAGANAYWNTWKDVALIWPRNDRECIPDHWKVFGARHSPLTGGPRLAVNPPNAIMNYCYALLESESRLAVSAVGLDPGLGLIHKDAPARDSLALDIMEVVRPSVDSWLLNWITREPFRRSDFFEERNGNCRLSGSLCSRLSETALTWFRLLAPWAEYVAQTLWTERGSSAVRTTPTRLTQANRRKAKGSQPFPYVEAPQMEHACLGCGKKISIRRKNCSRCAIDDATLRLTDAARLGRIAGHTPEALAREAITQRGHAKARSSWDASKQPAWPTSEAYSEKIQPRLASVSSSVIASCIGVSRWYAGRIRAGYRPHPRHWRALAELVRVSPELQMQS